MDDKELKQAQRLFLQIAGPGTTTRSSSLALCLVDDPNWRPAVGPIIIWTMLVWRAMIGQHSPQHDLPHLRALAGPVLENPPQKWSDCRGPFGAAILSAKRLGWRFESPFKLIDSESRVHILTTTSPSLLQTWMKQAWSTQLHVKAAAKLGLQGQLDTSVARGLVKEGVLPSSERSTLLAYLTQSIWTHSCLKKAGYPTEGNCQCGHHSDDLHHRLVSCPCTAPLRDENFSSSEAEALLDPSKFPLQAGFLEGLDWATGAPEGLGLERCVVWTRDGVPIQEALRGKIYTDGSCLK